MISGNNLTWVQTNSPIAGSRTDDIWFFDSQAGWLVNSDGDVQMTVDGGESWDHQKHTIDRGYLRCMGWGSRRVGWIGALTGGGPGYLDALLNHTIDGGESWAPVTNLPEGAPAGICGFCAVNEEVAYGSGSNDPNLTGPGVIKTLDGGATWELIPMSDKADNLIDILFVDEMTGWVVGGKKDPSCPEDKPGFEFFRQYAQLRPVVLKTTDGGRTWENQAAGIAGLACGEWGWKIQFLPGNEVGYVSLEDLTGAAILRTTDGGEIWVRLPITDEQGQGFNQNLEGVGFLNAQQGWVGGWGNQFNGLQNSHTTNGGESWIREDHIASDPESDRRIRINRYRFLGNPPTAAYCSGTQVYKLAFEDQRPAAALVGGRGVRTDRFSLTSADSGPGTDVPISYTVPDNAKHLYVGIWNHFAIPVRTLVEQADPAAGSQSVIWDRKDDSGNPVGGGMYMCRMFVDGKGQSAMIPIAR